jgi:oligosaccharide repeat unit polymerase
MHSQVKQVSSKSFPRSLLWAIVVVLHLTALYYLDTSTLVEAAVLLLMGQFVLSVALLWALDSGLLLHDLRLVFVVVYTLYGAVNPLGTVLAGYGGSEGQASATLLFATGLMAFNAVQMIQRRPFVATLVLPPTRKRLNAILILSLTLGLAWTLWYGLQLGYPLNLGGISGMRVRLIESGAKGDQLWTITQMIMQGMFCFAVFTFSKQNWLTRMVVLITFSVYALFQLGIGNRRELVPVILFAVAQISWRRQASLRPAYVVILAGIFILFIWQGVVRNSAVSSLSLTSSEEVKNAFLDSEFRYPFETLAFYVEFPPKLQYGQTYLLRFPQYLIPRVLWPGKPRSLAEEFLIDLVGTTNFQGFAYSPVTEAFINFGWVGPAVVFALVSFLFSKLIRVSANHPGLYLVVLSCLVDYGRGESGTILYQLLFVCGAFYALSWLCLVRDKVSVPSNQSIEDCGADKYQALKNQGHIEA